MHPMEAVKKKKTSVLYTLVHKVDETQKGGKVKGFRCWYYDENEDVFENLDFPTKAVKNPALIDFLKRMSTGENINSRFPTKYLIAQGQELLTEEEINGTATARLLTDTEEIEDMLTIMSRVYGGDDKREEKNDIREVRRRMAEEALRKSKAERNDDIQDFDNIM